ncbi:MAG: DUF4878 domain-containing protein [Porphyromonas sp.]|uniref:DUF4878 domain-containing protein n=1 Tax=Porphyromonas sp. TaxID=1924944 RepID=UPI002A74EA05|nr:DUF4878 domain-containing protein [Porphyromonas sp.]MDY3111473.1 DUF4878 domain-containing protein [Porphyromonas sp.]
MKRLALISIALVSMLAFAACSSPTKKAERVTMDFVNALNASDYDKARSYTASEQAKAYVGLVEYFDSEKSDDSEEAKAARAKITSRITRTEQQQDTVICYVETIEPSDNPDTLNQKVILTKVDNEWKVVEVPMK